MMKPLNVKDGHSMNEWIQLVNIGDINQYHAGYGELLMVDNV